MSTPLTDRQRRVLVELAYATREGQWVRPLDVGGTGHNGTGAVLVALVRMGLAERKPRQPAVVRGPRGSYVYRATADGRAVGWLE